jgi:hypothetical protein
MVFRKASSLANPAKLGPHDAQIRSRTNATLLRADSLFGGLPDACVLDKILAVWLLGQHHCPFLPTKTA